MTSFPAIVLPDLFSDDGEPARRAWLLRLIEQTEAFLETGADIVEWVAAYQSFRRSLVEAVWRATLPEHLVERTVYICMGSTGRSEDLLGSDLDHAVITLDHGLNETLRPHLHRFTLRMQSLGVPMCQGFVMSTNPRWLGSLETWMKRVEQYFDFPDWDNARYLYMILDGTPLLPPSHPWDLVYRRVFEGVRQSAFICWEMAHLGIHRSVALNVFGTMRTKVGERGAVLNVKEGLQSPITHSIRLLAVANGCDELSTLARIRFLKAGQLLSADLAVRVEQAVKFAWRVRLTNQVAAFREGSPTSDLVEVVRWGKTDKELLLGHLDTAKQLERFTHRLFKKPR